MDKIHDFIVDKDGYLKVETYRSGPFVFQIGLDFSRLELLKVRVEEAHARLNAIPMLPDFASTLERMALITAIHGTNTIEGGLLSEQETEAVIQSPPSNANQDQQRIINLKAAYSTADKLGSLIAKGIAIAKEKIKNENAILITPVVKICLRTRDFKDVHALITQNLHHPDNKPGEYRNNPKSRITRVGDEEHGGVYKPPQCHKDIELLMRALVAWANSEPVFSLPIIYRAALVHYYYELIHPFWDGNGRVGRVIEATILRANYHYAAHAISAYYLRHIDKYFTLFNFCRKQAEKKIKYPNTAFVMNTLEGMLDTLNRLQDKVNEEITKLSFNQYLVDLYKTGKVNKRQQAILEYLHQNPEVRDRDRLARERWYQALYDDYHPRTKNRDLKKLQECGVIAFNNKGEIFLSLDKPNYRLAD